MMGKFCAFVISKLLAYAFGCSCMVPVPLYDQYRYCQLFLLLCQCFLLLFSLDSDINHLLSFFITLFSGIEAVATIFYFFYSSVASIQENTVLRFTTESYFC